MKANKALKRLAKIEASVSDLAKRFLPSAPHIREVLQDAKAAVLRAKEAVLQESAGTAKKKTGAPNAGRPTKKSPPALKKSTGKQVEMKAAARKGKKRAPIKKTPKKAAAKRLPSAPISAMTDITPQEPVITDIAPQELIETPALASVVGNT